MNEQGSETAFSAAESLWQAALVVTFEATGDTIRSFVHIPSSRPAPVDVDEPAIAVPPFVPPTPAPLVAVPIVATIVLAVVCGIAGVVIGFLFGHA